MSMADVLRNELREAIDRARVAQEIYGDFASMHEAYGVLAEEFAELLEAIRIRRDSSHRPQDIRNEALDIAAVALRIAEQAHKVKR